MTIRRLLFILFLYVLLVWIVVFLLHSGDSKQIVYLGLLWTAIGVGALLVLVLLERAIGWWWARRARKAARPAAQAASPKALQEDDVELVRLVREADQRLSQAPDRADTKFSSVLDLPLYLIVGPERAGKTAVVHNCGIEPPLLAGQAVGGDGAVTPTRVANLWLAHQSLFVELSGRIFNSEPSRLSEFLSFLQPWGGVRGWKAWLKRFRPPASLRGVLLVVDSKAFAGTPEPSALDRSAQQIRERLSVISSVLEAEFPVYVIFTNADAIPYFEEFFRGVAEPEAGQVLGVLGAETPREQTQERVWAEAESKRLNRCFQSLFLKLSDRRLLALTHETESKRKAAIYEFPREFKRMRTPMVQFLVDVFKPDPLKAAPRLRGFFFTGARKEERVSAAFPDTQTIHWIPGAAPDATQIFSPQTSMSAVFRPTPKAGSGPLVNRWLFLTELFHSVLASDRPVIRRAPPKFEQYRKAAVATAAGLALCLGVIWTVSWFGNWTLTSNVKDRIREVRNGSSDLSLANLEALDRLRTQLEKLDENPWHLHWGLYRGNTLRAVARRVYFGRLKQLSLDRLNQVLAADLMQAGAAGRTTGEEVTYDELKTHRTITALGCPADPSFLTRQLRGAAANAHPGLSGDEQTLLGLQLGYYASDLAKKGKLPVALNEDRAAETNAQAFLRRIRGPAQYLRRILDQVDQTVPRFVAAGSIPDLKLVLAGQEEVRGAFTAQGRQRFEDLVMQGNFGPGDTCVMGSSVSQDLSNLREPGAKEQLVSLYYDQYIAAWREFLASYHVIGYPKGYPTAEDAAGKLDRLSGPRSSLLGLVKMVADNTNFPAADTGDPSLIAKAKDFVKGAVDTKAKTSKGVGQLQQILEDKSSLTTAADVVKVFQPPSYTTPTGLDQLVSDHNQGYIGGLRALQGKMDTLAHASTTAEKAAAMADAGAAQGQARNALKQMADKFQDFRNEGLDGVLERLLEEPIGSADALLVQKSPAITKNGELLSQVCLPMKPILLKYPFNQAAKEEAKSEVSPAELETWFAPNIGKIWKYATGSGADLVVFHAGKWEQNPMSQDMKVSPELLNFLNGAQQLTKAFFSKGGTEPGFTYELRPTAGQTGTIQLKLDGTEMDKVFQTTFSWPAASGKSIADGMVFTPNGSSHGFGQYPGLWAVFRLFEAAAPREPNAKEVQWNQVRGNGGLLQSFSPAVKVDIVAFPGDVDVFQPKFFESLAQCPKKAVAAN